MASGDGWARCQRGHRHWGRFGAAGLLLIRRQELLLQLRSNFSHHGGTWSIPGGARDSHESADQAALRESREEIGLLAVDVEITGDFVDDHGGWSYTTVLARPLGPLRLRHNHESDEARWVPVAEVTALPLHPGFEASWAELIRSPSALAFLGADPPS